MGGKSWKILLADDHVVAREGVKVALGQLKETEGAEIIEVSDGSHLINALKGSRYDLLIVDPYLEGADGLHALDLIQKEKLDIPSIVFSRYDNARLRKAVMIRGAKGFVFKSQPLADLKSAVSAVLKGKKYSLPIKERVEKSNEQGHFSTPMQERCSLTRREVQVLQLIAASLSNKEIASQLFISEQTVGVHRKNLMRKLGARNKTSLVRAAYEHQFIE